MARHNILLLYGAVWKKPEIRINNDTGEPIFGVMYITILRGYRSIKDGKKYTRRDHPPVITTNPAILHKMQDLDVNDIVMLKGTFATKNLKKNSFCTHCKENDVMTKNTVNGTMAYVNPIHLRKICHYADQEQAVKDLNDNKEISNQAYALGTLVRDPKQFKTKYGLVITQYQIALNRKYKTRTDPPEIRTDYPWVKSYGEQAAEDRIRLRTGSIVYIDGIIQARTVERRMTCSCCGKEYKWQDKTMEFVPYEMEYMPGTFYTDDDIEKMHNQKLADILSTLFTSKEVDDDVAEEERSLEDEKY